MQRDSGIDTPIRHSLLMSDNDSQLYTYTPDSAAQSNDAEDWEEDCDFDAPQSNTQQTLKRTTPTANDYYVCCQRNQLTDYYINLPFGVFFYDLEFVVKVSYVPDGVTVAQASELYIRTLEDYNNSNGYFYKGGILGGTRKKKRQEQKPKKLTGGGAYSAPQRISMSGAGAYNVGKAMKRGLASIKKESLTIAKSAVKTAIKEGVARSIQGAGSYTVPNQLVNNNYPTSEILSSRDESDSRVITGVEYFGDVFNNTGSILSGVAFPMNPGLMLPKLQQLAANYISYELKQLVFMFKSDVVSTGGSLGEILMYFSMNPDSPSASSKLEILDYHGGMSARVDQDCMLGVECDAAKTQKPSRLYIRTTGVTGAITTYDYGNLNVYTYNVSPSVVANGTVVGRLYAYYTIKLCEPVLGTYLGNTIRQDDFVCDVNATYSGFFYSTTLLQSGIYNNAGGTFYTNNVYTFGDNTVGSFRLTCVFYGTTFANAPTGITTSGNIVILSDVGASLDAASVIVASTTFVVLCYDLRVTAASTARGNYITFVPGSFTAGTLYNTSFQLTQVNPSRSGLANL